MTATVFDAAYNGGPGDGAEGASPGVQQTAHQFPFTYTYYGFGAAPYAEDMLYGRAPVSSHTSIIIGE